MLLLLVASCGPAPRPPVVTPPPAAVPEAARERWGPFDDVRSWPVLNARPFASRGHLEGKAFVEVKISPDARDAYLALVRDSVLPEGTIVALFFGDEARASHGPVYVMHKQAAGWRFLAMDERGGLDPKADALACARCHDGAPADSVFGLPRSAEVAAAVRGPEPAPATSESGEITPAARSP